MPECHHTFTPLHTMKALQSPCLACLSNDKLTKSPSRLLHPSLKALRCPFGLGSPPADLLDSHMGRHSLCLLLLFVAQATCLLLLAGCGCPKFATFSACKFYSLKFSSRNLHVFSDITAKRHCFLRPQKLVKMKIRHQERASCCKSTQRFLAT